VERSVSQLFGGAGDLGWVVLKTVLLFATAVAAFRISDRRTLAQLGAFDFAAAVAVGAIIGRTATSPSTSYLTGAVALVGLLTAHRVVTEFRRRAKASRITDQPPRVLVADGTVQDHELAKAGLTTSDLFALLREHQVTSVEEVRYVLYETRGALTVLRAGYPTGPLLRDGLAAAGYQERD
jgi:uncharacterized membrane protein YcaP (DUF421 family)